MEKGTAGQLGGNYCEFAISKPSHPLSLSKPTAVILDLLAPKFAPKFGISTKFGMKETLIALLCILHTCPVEMSA